MTSSKNTLSTVTDSMRVARGPDVSPVLLPSTVEPDGHVPQSTRATLCFSQMCEQLQPEHT